MKHISIILICSVVALIAATQPQSFTLSIVLSLFAYFTLEKILTNKLNTEV